VRSASARGKAFSDIARGLQEIEETTMDCDPFLFNLHYCSHVAVENRFDFRWMPVVSFLARGDVQTFQFESHLSTSSSLFIWIIDYIVTHPHPQSEKQKTGPRILAEILCKSSSSARLPSDVK
jgi:hypothetical protein